MRSKNADKHSSFIQHKQNAFILLTFVDIEHKIFCDFYFILYKYFHNFFINVVHWFKEK